MKGNIPRASDGRPLSRQEQLLLLIEQRTEVDDSGQLQRYYTPHMRSAEIVIDRQHYNIGQVFGASDAASLRALERKGWIKRVTSPTASLNRYSYRIAEEGQLVTQTLVP